MGKEESIMDVSEKAKEKLDKAGKEIKEAIDSLKKEVSELTSKVKDKVKGTGEEMQNTAEELTREVKRLSEKVKDLIPKKGKQSSLPVRIDKLSRTQPEIWEQPFLELRRSTDKLFDDFFRSFGRPMAEFKNPWGFTTKITAEEWPFIDINETEEEIRITAELPGVARDDIDISVTETSVAIRGEKREQEERKGTGYYKLERSYGSFQRHLDLPCEVQTESADASFKDGVLTLRLPKTASARERIRKIPVRNG